MSSRANITARLPATKSIAWAASDSVVITYNSEKVRTRGISATVGGDIAYKDEEGNSLLAKGLAAGVIHAIAAVQILATGTTATGLTVYW